MSGLREEHQTVLSRLKEAHSLLEKHVEASNKAQEGEVHYAPALLYLLLINSYRDLLSMKMSRVYTVYVERKGRKA